MPDSTSTPIDKPTALTPREILDLMGAYGAACMDEYPRKKADEIYSAACKALILGETERARAIITEHRAELAEITAKAKG